MDTDAVDPPAEEVRTTYWKLENLEGFGMPAIVEVRTWTCGEHRVDTPLVTYVHWENTGQYWPEDRKCESVLLEVEEFVKLRSRGEIIQIGSEPTNPA